MDGMMEPVEAYFEALKTGDEELFKRAFREDAAVINAGENDPEKVVTPIAEFVEKVKKRHNEGTNLEEIPLGITASQVGNVGNIRVDFKLVIGDKVLYGTDYFNVIKRKNQWKISQKIYDVVKEE